MLNRLLIHFKKISSQCENTSGLLEHATKTFGKLFKSEFDTIGKVADDRVKRLQTQYIKLGRDTSGVMKAIAIMPNQLDMSNFSTQITS
jgi:hypothetical protein